MSESWMLYLDTRYQAMRWPWMKPWDALTADDVQALPGAVSDFTRNSPSDGFTESHVPVLPCEHPRCMTRLAIYHDDEYLYVFIDAVRPAKPIAELADLEREDFSCIFNLDGMQRGLYFGMNERGEHIGCVQLWETSVLPATDMADYPWRLLTQQPGIGPCNSAGGILSTEYDGRVITTPDGYIGTWKIARTLLPSSTLRVSAARRCYATSERVCWGGPIIWQPRLDMMGTLELVDAVHLAILPTVHRVDVCYDPVKETGEFTVTLHGPATADAVETFTSVYAGFQSKYTLALNGIEHTDTISPVVKTRFAIPDGWNRLACVSAFGHPLEITFEKRSGNRIVSRGYETSTWPDEVELRDAFAAWHADTEQQYHRPGTWTPGEYRDDAVYCLEHNGVFTMLPYALAYRWIDPRPVYLERIRQTCDRMLAEQDAEGWFPCYCSGVMFNGRPPRFEGGAFTNGSVGEAMVIGEALLADPCCLDSAVRAAEAYHWYRWEDNQNYIGFALWHLSALYARLREERFLTQAVHYARHFVTRDIGISGATGGHNYYTGYGDITLKGMAQLLQVLPPEHTYYPVLREQVIRYTNQMLARQQPDGLFAGCNRRYLGYTHTLPSLFEVARALPECAHELEPALLAMYRAQASKPDGAVITQTARYLAEQRAGVRG